MLTPNQIESLSAEVLRIYADAERILLERIARRLKKGINEEGWAERKLLELRRVRQEALKQISKLERGGYKAVNKAVETAYKEGSKTAIIQLKKVGKKEITTNFGIAHKTAIEELAKETVNILGTTHSYILRKTQDIYRDVIAETSTQVLTGTQTRIQAAQSALNRFANKGITSFVDKTGRSWEMATYSEMATRTATTRAQIRGHQNRLVENGRDLVVVSSHADSCPLCDPWEGEILSLTGNTPGYPTLADAEGEGLFHPNCSHSFSIYVEGLTEKPEPEPGGRDYEIRQQQRYNERQIRKWKRRKAVALTEEEAQKAQRKISEWQARQRGLVEKHDLRRKYEREQIKRAR